MSRAVIKHTPVAKTKSKAKAKSGATGNKKGGKGQHGPLHIIPPASDPMAVARQFMRDYQTEDGSPMIKFWRGGWLFWRTSHWVEREDRAMRSLLYKYTESALYLTALGPVPWMPNRKKIGDLYDALAAITILPVDVDQPCWLDGRESGTIVATANGLLDIDSRRLLPHSAAYFNLVSVPFDFDADAPEPRRWLSFLEELWPDDPQAIDALSEWYGYVISGRLDLHKILLMVGPTRGGKGVIARCLGTLVGEKNVAGPTLSSLGGDFGLAPLLGKTLAVISDARFVGRNGGVVVERLLSISGEDSLTVNRKYRDQWTGKLPCRLHVVSNELPRLGDASQAIVGRIVLLVLTRSWLGREDHGLEVALRGEMCGILNWALDGLHRLTNDNDNAFTRMATADEALAQMRDLASPVGAYVRERCELGGTPLYEVKVDDLYQDFKVWADDAGHHKSTRQIFGRDLHSAFPAIKMKRPETDEEKRVRVYLGIRIRGKA
jgi:putative DNA primase/helicase